MSISLSALLTSSISTGTQNEGQLRLAAIGKLLTNRLNAKITTLKNAVEDPVNANVLSAQVATLSKQNAAYSAALPLLGKNAQTLSDITLQLGTLANAAAAGDAATFDSALSAAQTDVNNLIVTQPLHGFSTDGVGLLRTQGLGIQSSATYNLSTTSGQAQAQADVGTARTTIAQVVAAVTQNQAIANSVSQALTTRIDQLNSQASDQKFSALADAQQQISKLQTQTQTEFHLLELELGGTTNVSSVLATGQTGLQQALAAQPGSTNNATDPNAQRSVFFSALEGNTAIANQTAAIIDQAARRQPANGTAQSNSLRSAAASALLTLFA